MLSPGTRTEFPTDPSCQSSDALVSTPPIGVPNPAPEKSTFCIVVPRFISISDVFASPISVSTGLATLKTSPITSFGNPLTSYRVAPTQTNLEKCLRT